MVAWMRQNRSGGLSLIFLLLIGLVAMTASLIAPYDPLAQDLSSILESPSTAHPFGTDELGRDLLSRVIFGSRASLATAAIAVAGAGTVGALLGLVAGYFGRWSDAAIMRLMDFLLAVPGILLAITITAILGTGFGPAAIAITIVSIPTFARLGRASVLALKEEEFVHAAHTAGASHLHVMFRTILPNALNPLIVQASITAATAILIEAALSFLGLGTQPPDASWGLTLSLGKSYLRQAPWYSIMPGLVLTATVLAIDTVGHALQRSFGGVEVAADARRGG